MTSAPARAALAVVALVCGTLAGADTVRVATYHSELQRDGPGKLLADILSGDDPQILAVLDVLDRTAPDIVALQGLDWDYDGLALAAFVHALDNVGQSYPHVYASQPNTGLETGLDLDGDGRLGGAANSQGFGKFTGQGGMAVLSRFPILTARVQDFTGMLWSDLPGHIMPVTEFGRPFPSPEAQAIQRLSSAAHWVVPVQLPSGEVLSLMTYHAGPPVFDGPEDRNGRRNHDETRFWRVFLDGRIGTAPKEHFVMAGSAALDPEDSEGLRQSITALLADRRMQDPRPTSAGAAIAPDQGHRGNPALDTVDWPPPGPGRLRVDYVLPSADWRVAGSGVHWPAPGEPGHEAALSASRHRLVWVDLFVPSTP